jgi:hypothetical protein
MRYWLLSFFLLCTVFLKAQVVVIDTASASKNKAINKITLKDSNDVHSPRKAAVMSAIIPGLGQIYNEKYWKVGVIYAGAGFLTYYFKRNIDSLKSYQSAYAARIDTSAATIDTKYTNLSNASVLSNRNFHRRQRDIALLGFFGLYALQIIDANVDAHLREFEINKDLSMKITPVFSGLVSTSPNIGLNIRFKF